MSNSPTPTPEPWGFTRPHRLAFALLLTLLLVVLFLQYHRRPARLDIPIANDPNPITLPQRIDPNTASLLELTRIPNLGPALAQKIIDYREARLPLAPDRILFRQPEDLTHITGLKEKSLAPLLPYLEFPPDPDSDPPATAPN